MGDPTLGEEGSRDSNEKYIEAFFLHQAAVQLQNIAKPFGRETYICILAFRQGSDLGSTRSDHPDKPGSNRDDSMR
jgi:hypothetical protein